MINNSYLLGLYGYDSATISSLNSGASAVKKKTQPTAPWSSSVKQQPQSELLRTALSGRRFINESTTSLDLKGANSGDYRKLFAMYQGMTMLEALAQRGTQTNLTAIERAQLTKRMDAGLAEITEYLSDLDLQGVKLVEGTSSTKAQTTAAVARDSAVYITGAIHTGAVTAPVAAFEGDVQFGISVKRGTTQSTVNIDLSEMGSEPRTLQSVTSFINGKLEAAGYETRIGRELLPAEKRVVKVGDKTINLPDGPEQWALKVQGSTVEKIQFVPVDSAKGVYVVQGNGSGTQEVLKFQEGTTYNTTNQPLWVDGQIGKSALPEGVETVRASAVGPDGSVWLVADVSEGLNNQPIKGSRDVVLMKLDSTGQVVMSRALGAADTANGFAIAIDANGRVAVAGSVEGGLLPGGSVADANTADSFVTLYDANGTEQWTQRRGAKAADEATAVSFGDDGRIYVAGRSKSAMPGTLAVGGWDGYVQAFSETQTHSVAPIIATATGATQFGTAGEDSVQAMTTVGDKLYTAGIENGRIVVRNFQINSTGAPTLLSSRDLGNAGSGEIAGLSVVDGKVIIAGQTRNGALDIGQVNTAHSGGFDAFVAVLSDDLTAAGTDRLTYVGGAGDDTAADVKIVDGKVYLTGVSDRALNAKDEDPAKGYLSRIDPVSGAVEWNQTWMSAGLKAMPTSIAVANNGASVLDRLGLPQGEISQGDSKRLVDATSLRVGDRFYVTSPTGRETAITITAKDTLQTLASRIEVASGRSLKVTIKTDRDYVTGMDGNDRITAGGVQRLSITHANDRGGAILRSGESGRDALGGLGLTPGYVGPTDKDGKTIGINLPNSISVKDAASSKTALETLATAIKALRSAYTAMAPKPKISAANVGPAPAHLQAQIANYQAALARLTS